MTNPNDGSTTLNVGRGGDLSDASVYTQTDEVTEVHRARVALGHDDGRLVTEEHPVPVGGGAVLGLLTRIAASLESIDLRLRAAVDGDD